MGLPFPNLGWLRGHLQIQADRESRPLNRIPLPAMGQQGLPDLPHDAIQGLRKPRSEWASGHQYRGCTTPILNSPTSPTPAPGGTSPFYPYFIVGDPSAARFLFLGVDQPSYHAHTFMATLEYRF